MYMSLTHRVPLSNSMIPQVYLPASDFNEVANMFFVLVEMTTNSNNAKNTASRVFERVRV